MHRGFSRTVAILMYAVLLAGCATGAGKTTKLGDGKIELTKAVKEDMIALLDKLANNALLQRADKSADMTLAWVDEQVKATTFPMDPLKAALARACPQAIKASTVDLRSKIDRLKGLLGDTDGPGPVSGFLVFDLTRLKYGPKGSSPKVEFEQIKDDIGVRVDALFTGCFHLFPKEQVMDLMETLAKLGIATQTGGMLGGLGGLGGLGLLR